MESLKYIGTVGFHNLQRILVCDLLHYLDLFQCSTLRLGYSSTVGFSNYIDLWGIALNGSTAVILCEDQVSSSSLDRLQFETKKITKEQGDSFEQVDNFENLLSILKSLEGDVEVELGYYLSSYQDRVCEYIPASNLSVGPDYNLNFDSREVIPDFDVAYIWGEFLYPERFEYDLDFKQAFNFVVEGRTVGTIIDREEVYIFLENGVLTSSDGRCQTTNVDLRIFFKAKFRLTD